MLTIAYLVFILLSSPVASITITGGETTSTGNSIHVDSVSTSGGGFIAVYDGDEPDSELLGYSTYLPPGTHSGITVPLQNGEITEDQEIRIVAHRDTNGDEQFDFQPGFPEGESSSDAPYRSLSDRGTPGINVDVIFVGGNDE
jgi:flagellar protein FlaJ